MNSSINKIFRGIVDEEIHDEFVKFSRGVFQNKYLLEGKRQKNAWAVKTGAEYTNYLVRKCLSEIPNDTPIKINGVVVSTKDLKNELKIPISKVKQFAGVRQAIIATEIKPSLVLAEMDRLPKAFFALSFRSLNSDLKVKAKAPKSGKPSPKGEKGVAADFCRVKTNDESLIADLFFDSPNFTQISVEHTIEVKKIMLPKDTTDPRELREKAQRHGIIKRKIISDGEVFEETKEFTV